MDWARIGRLDGGARVQVLNLVAVPDVAAKAPIVAVEALFFGGALHLLVIDALGEGPRTREALATRRAAVAQEWDLEAEPEWGAGAFSADLIFLKPGKKNEPGPDVVLPWVLEVAGAQVADLGAAGAADVSEEEARGRWKERRHFLRVQREHEPARPFLERLTGDPELVERLLEGFLYPPALESARDGRDPQLASTRLPPRQVREPVEERFAPPDTVDSK